MTGQVISFIYSVFSCKAPTKLAAILHGFIWYKDNTRSTNKKILALEKIIFFRQIMNMSAQLLTHVKCLVTPWTVAHQSPLSMEFSRQEYWSRLPFPSPGDLPNPGIEPLSLALTGGFFTTSATREAPDNEHSDKEIIR